MRALLALLIVAAGAAALYFTLSPGGDDPTQPAAPQSGDPAVATTQDPVTHTDLEAGASERAVVTPDRPAAPTRVRPETLWSNRLRGRVVGPDGQRGVEDARVTLTLYGPEEIWPPSELDRVPDRSVTTGNEGRFVFESLDPDEEHTLIAYRADVGRRMVTHVKVGMGQVSEELTIVLEPGARLFGKVTDTTGVGLDGVELILAQVIVGGETAATTLAGTSDAAGAYAFENLGEGNYSLSAWKDGFGRKRLTSLNISGHDGVELDLALDVAYLIEGVVRAEDGSPIEGASIEARGAVRGDSASTLSRARTDERGHFSFADIAEGAYDIQANAPGYRPGRKPRVQTGELNVEILLAPQPTISGRVQDPAGNPLGEFTVQLRRRMVNSEETIPVPRARFVIKNSRDGAFRLSCPRQGEYLVEASNPKYAPSFSEPVFVDDGASVSDVVVRMTAGGTLRGRVVDSAGVPVAGARVRTHASDYVDDPFWQQVAFPSDATEAETLTKADGRFAIGTLTPENYQIHVTHADHAPLIVRQLVVGEGADVDAGELKVSSGASLSGLVASSAGQGLADVQVSLTLAADAATGEHGAFYSTSTDEQGRYGFEHVPAGRYKIHCQRRITSPGQPGANDFKTTQRAIVLVEGGKTNEGFTLD